MNSEGFRGSTFKWDIGRGYTGYSGPYRDSRSLGFSSLGFAWVFDFGA